ncbi:MAG: hypothetical protein GQ470_00960 [Gammaproteobacteria bacterium]|nr:hypothetical protein [Gammaproteobacteria bacterium]
MRTLTILLALFVLYGCATNKAGYRKESTVEQQSLDMTKEEVLIDLGPPTKKIELSGNRESWRYESEVSGLSGGECTLSILFNGENVKQAILSANDLFWISFPLGSCTKIIQTLR